MKLFEIFNTTSDLENSENVEFLEDTSTRLRIAAEIGKRTIEFDAERLGGFWKVGFHEVQEKPHFMNPEGKLSWGMTGSGSAPQVMSFVRACMKLLLSDKKPREVHFSADGKDSSRAKVYQRMIERESSTDYELTTEEGNDALRFILKRKT